jgi:DNA repair photolyase
LELEESCDVDAENSINRVETEWFEDDTQSIVTENASSDIPFRYSLNPYRGCEHGCAYCYARPYHEYLGWTAGSDFETKILVKSRAAELLRDWLSRASWNGSEHLMLSGVTDPYQPIERKLRITRRVLEVLAEARQAVGIITKNALVTRDIDLLVESAKFGAVQVCFSITTADRELAMILEPRCSVPEARFRAARELADAGIPVHVNVAPLIPGLNDHEIPELLEAGKQAGASSASWILLRLPGAVEPIFLDWLDRHRPNAKNKIMERIRSLRGGRLNESHFNTRMRGDGFFSDEWSKLFDVMRRKLGLAERPEPFRYDAFRTPKSSSGQGFLF